MNDLQRRFMAIRNFYQRHHAEVMAAVDVWHIDPYAWDHEGGIRLTPIESALWHDIRAEGLVLHPQYPVGRFFVDFGNPVAKVAIECDGAQWHQDKEKDASRQREIEALGWRVYRITGSACFSDFVETEHHCGRISLQAGEARRFIREIAQRHSLMRGLQ